MLEFRLIFNGCNLAGDVSTVCYVQIPFDTRRMTNSVGTMHHVLYLAIRPVGYEDHRKLVPVGEAGPDVSDLHSAPTM